MHINELFAAQHRRPFVPLRLHVSDGTAYDLLHPEMFLLTSHTIHIGIGGIGLVPEHAVYIDVGHVTRLEVLATAPNGNGDAP